MDVETLFETSVEAVERLFADGELVAVAYSGGKDSTAVLIAAVEALRRHVARGGSPLPLAVLHNDTGIENPEVRRHARDQLNQLETYALESEIPVDIRVSGPSLADSFAVKVVGGLALPTFANAASRRCSMDWKVKPGTRMARALIPEHKTRCQEALASDDGVTRTEAQDRLTRLERLEMPVLLVGTRFAESAGRSQRMTARGESAIEIAEIRDDEDRLLNRTLAPICHWSESDVWELLALAGQRDDALFPAWRHDFDGTVALYRDSGGGECVITQICKDKPRAACGARHGCAMCVVTGQDDKSLSALAESPRYAYLRDVLALRTWIARSQFDWTTRCFMPRKVENDRMALAPGGYSAEVCAFLLRALATLDLRESERAARFRAQSESGQEPEEARLIRQHEGGEGLGLSDAYFARKQPLFRFLGPAELIAIDFNWALYGLFLQPFHALKLYSAVIDGGESVDLDQGRRTPRGALPELGTIDLSGLGSERASGIELDAGRSDPRPLFSDPPFQEADFCKVDVARAKRVIAAAGDPLSSISVEHARSRTPETAVRFYLANRIVRPAKGQLTWIDGRMQLTQKLLARGLWKGMPTEALLGRAGAAARRAA
ncbi:phosphoadenosine phosphosulfate reductase domain-containing protein [Rhodovibrio sodomensis]|nr:phosphoadenosine phosphosulfate reductase family protein [Rhodovibrio sodomensis]